MKSTLVLFTMLLCVNVYADRYTDLMMKNIEAVYKGKTIEELQAAVNSFERIGGAEKTKWEPYYYASFGYVMITTREQDNQKKDGYLDQAKAALDKALAIKSDESEIFALEGFIHMLRVAIDPASRGQQYSMMAMQSYGKSLGLNSQNPRALGLLAQLQFGTAKFFNQAPTEACETARKSLAIYQTQPEGLTIAPVWGRGMTEELVKGCQ